MPVPASHEFKVGKPPDATTSRANAINALALALNYSFAASLKVYNQEILVSCLHTQGKDTTEALIVLERLKVASVILHAERDRLLDLAGSSSN